MQIKFISTKFDQKGGGSNRSLGLLADRLAEDHEVEILTFQPDMNHLVDPPVPVQEYPSSSWLNTLQNCVRVLSELEEETDIYHIFSPVLIPAAGLYRKWGDTPVIGRLNSYSLFCTNPSIIDSECYKNCTLMNKISHDDSPIKRKPKRLHKYIFKQSALSISSSVDQFFAQSPSVKEIYADAGLSAPITVVPNFYDPDFPAGSSRRPQNREQILYVGRLTKEKGVDLLLDSFHRLNDRGAKLTIVGDGPQRSLLEKKVTELPISDQVEFRGWVSYNQLGQVYAQSSVFVHPGLWPEPFGNTTLEAMQHQLPIIVSNTGGPPWIAKGAAITFEPGSVQELTHAISHLDESKRDQLARRCSERIDRFSPKKVVNTVENEYRKVI